jgi:hypothetical protein
MQSVSTFYILRCADLCVSIWVGKVTALLMACENTYKWNFTNLKKRQNPEILRDP